MKTYASFLIFFLAYTSCFAQQNEKKFFFKDVGWTINLPGSFVVIDSIDDARRNQNGLKAIEESNNIKADISETITLISATRNTYNYFNSTITPFDIAKDGSWESATQTVKDIVYKTFSDKMPDAKIDSSSGSMLIDGLRFDAYKITVKINDKTLFTSFLLSRLYRGYDFGISYVYIDEETRQLVEKMLSSATFGKLP